MKKIEKGETIVVESVADETKDRSNLVTRKKARRPVRKDENLVQNLSEAKRKKTAKIASAMTDETTAMSKNQVIGENEIEKENSAKVNEGVLVKEMLVKEMSTDVVLDSVLQPKKRGRKKKVITEALAHSEDTSTKVVFQYKGNEVELQCLLQKAKEAFLEENGQKSFIHTLELYVKPEDNAAYYVVNGNEAGKVALI